MRSAFFLASSSTVPPRAPSAGARCLLLASAGEASWVQDNSNALASNWWVQRDGADPLILGFERSGEAGVVRNEQVLVVVSIGVRGEVEGAEDRDVVVDDDDLVVHSPGVAILEHVQ